MRQILFTVALLASTAVLAATDAQQVVGYECKNIDAKKYGFDCSIKAGEMYLRLHEDARKMPKERHDTAVYMTKKIMLRYYAAGGHQVIITADYWSPNSAKLCSPTPSRAGSICQLCKGRDKDGNYTDCEM